MTIMRLKIFFAVGCVMAIAISAIFLVFNHRDLISHRVYSDATYYIHFNPQKIAKINNKYTDYLDKLVEITGLSTEAIENVYSLSGRELALIKYPNTSLKFVALPNTKLESYLTANKVNFFVDYNTKALYFPVDSDESFLDSRELLTSEPTKRWINLDFSLVKLYMSSQEFPFIDATIVKQYDLSSLWVYGYMWNNRLYLNTNIPAPKSQKTAIAENMSDIIHLFVNKDLPIKLKGDERSLDYLLINSFDQPVEYVKSSDGSAIFRVVNHQDVEDVLERIKKTVSVIYPEKQYKHLPDGTPVVHLIADSTSVEVQEVSVRTYLINIEQPVWVRLVENDIWVFVGQLALPRINLEASKPSQLGRLTFEAVDGRDGFGVDLTRTILGKLMICIY